VYLPESQNANGQAFGPDGRRYVVTGASTIAAYDSKAAKVIAGGFAGNDLVVAHNGNIYATNPPGGDSTEPSKVWLIRPSGEKSVVDTGLRYANGVTLSPDQSLLYVDDHRSHWVYSYQIQPDGTLLHKQRFYALHVPESADDAGADGMRVDRAGRLYVATRMGIQICDQAGKVTAILPTPNRRVSNLAFGGKNFDVLFATAGDRVYRRHLKTQGANAWAPPHLPPPPQL
jgi:sugar lactone lactonase YvrE